MKFYFHDLIKLHQVPLLVLWVKNNLEILKDRFPKKINYNYKFLIDKAGILNFDEKYIYWVTEYSPFLRIFSQQIVCVTKHNFP